MPEPRSVLLSLDPRFVAVSGYALLVLGFVLLVLSLAGRSEYGVGARYIGGDLTLESPTGGASLNAQLVVCIPSEGRSSAERRLQSLAVSGAAGFSLENPERHYRRAAQSCFEYTMPRTGQELALLTLTEEGAGDEVESDAAPVSVLVLLSEPLTWTGRAAVLLLLLSMLLRLLSYHLRPALAGSSWRWMDAPLLLLSALALTGVASSLLSGARPDVWSQLDALAPGEGQTWNLGDQGLHSLAQLSLHGFVYVALAYAWAVWRGGMARALALHRPQRVSVIWSGFLGVCLAVAATLLLFQVQPEEYSPMQWITSMPGTMLAMAAMACLAPWFEELFFRGAFYGALASRLPAALAAALCVALFTLAHLPQHVGYLWPLLPIFVVALLSTVLRVFTASTTAPFALHIGYNALLVLPAVLSS